MLPTPLQCSTMREEIIIDMVSINYNKDTRDMKKTLKYSETIVRDYMSEKTTLLCNHHLWYLTQEYMTVQHVLEPVREDYLLYTLWYRATFVWQNR